MESAWRELDLSYLGRQDGLGMTLTDVARIVRPKSLLLRNQKRAPEVSNIVMKANRMLVYESIPYHDSTSTMNMPTIMGKVSDRQTLFPHFILQRPALPYSTVTLFARFRGLSTSVPRAHAV